MLKPALLYENEIREEFIGIMFDGRFKFEDSACWRDCYDLKRSTWDKHEFVSVHKGKVIGYIAYGIDRTTDAVNGLHIINFTGKPNLIFAMDLKKALVDIFEKFHFSKLNFTCIIGNPILPQYDKLCLKHGGRIVGVWEKDAKLIDGEFYDLKLYEILKENFRR